MLTKGTRVTWTTASNVHGSGACISDEQDGHVLVAVDAPQGEEHRVIYCTVTWLTPQ
ncbi:MAG: hypothetical protein WAL85_04585 [Candidatus Korobacteraceae bacterium]